MLVAVETASAGFDADDLTPVVEEGMEQADGIGAAADRCDHMSGRRPSCSRICWRASVPITDWKSRTSSG
jgi:hypothetical protein